VHALPISIAPEPYAGQYIANGWADYAVDLYVVFHFWHGVAVVISNTQLKAQPQL
jgi:hypothetical protein